MAQRFSFILLLPMLVYERTPTSMAQRFSFILLLPMLVYGQCPPPYVEVGSRCLFFETVGEVTHPEAHQLCQAADGELAAVLTVTQHKVIVDYIYDNGLTGRTFWLDGSDVETEGVWITSTGVNLPMGTPFWAAYMKSQQPDNDKGIQHCLILNAPFNYYMDDNNCTREFNALCETPPLLQPLNNLLVNKSIDCPTFYVDVGGKCLSFMTWADETWESARQACVGLQGQLAAIDDVEVLRDIYLYLTQTGLTGNSFWLGGSDAAVEGSWNWLDGSPVPMGTPFWGLNVDEQGKSIQEPNGGTLENCLSLLSDGSHFFRDSDCQNQIANPLCEYTGQ